MPPAPAAFIEWTYVFESSNNFTLDSPFTLTMVTTSPVLWFSPCTVMITLNISFFAVSGELVVCAIAAGVLTIAEAARTSPSTNIDTRLSFFRIIPIVDKHSAINLLAEVKVYFSSEDVIYKIITLLIYESGLSLVVT
jgi:hypothetical protein